MTKKSIQKIKYLDNEKSFEVKLKAFFIIFKGISVVKSCLRPESVPLMSTIIFANYNYCCKIIFSHFLLYEINATIFFNSVLIFTPLKKNGSLGEQGLEGMNFVISWNFVKEQVLHYFTKYFSEARLSQIVNIDLNGKLPNLTNLLLSAP